jgi:alkanesulfonate monooxygenase SsuD/methylene tetrahydromethanopterin reductase-like flavin-dependent oxidoreductase (luciferase family)
VGVGIGVASVFSRTPALLGMSAVTLDHLSGGRGLLGLGVSSPPMVESWHGLAFERPLRRMRLDPLGDVPILNAAISSTNRRLTGEYADGWLPGFTPLSAFPGNLEAFREDRSPEFEGT